MAITNFIPTVWSENLYTELDKKYIAVKNCNRDFEGDIKGKGAAVKICGIGNVSVSDYTKNSDMTAPETLSDSVRTLTIDQAKYFNFQIDDVDRAQSNPKVMNEANEELSKMTSNKEKRKYLDAKEKDLFKNFEKDLRSMTRSQGKILIRLIDRECQQTSYEIIQIYRGSVAAVFWQGIAHLFGADLKAEYDGADKDKIIERIINLVEAGQL